MYRPDPLQPLLNLPVRGYRQPVRPVLNPNHPLSRGLVSCWLLNEGSGVIARDISPIANHGAMANFSANPWVDSHHGGQALLFDGTNDQITASTVATPAAYTFSFWARSHQPVSGSVYKYPFSSNGDTPSFVWDHFSAGFTQAVAHQKADSSYVAAQLTSTLTANTWYFICGTWDGANVRAYLNAALEATTAATTLKAQTGNLVLGAAGPGVNVWDGRLDIVRFYNSALSLGEIQWLFSEPYAGIEETRPRAASVGSAAAATAGFPYYQSFIGRGDGIGGSV